jgi:hypothetical protein
MEKKRMILYCIWNLKTKDSLIENQDKIDKHLIIDLKKIFKDFSGQYDLFLLQFIQIYVENLYEVKI